MFAFFAVFKVLTRYSRRGFSLFFIYLCLPLHTQIVNVRKQNYVPLNVDNLFMMTQDHGRKVQVERSLIE